MFALRERRSMLASPSLSTAGHHNFQLCYHTTTNAKLAQDTALLRWSSLAAYSL